MDYARITRIAAISLALGLAAPAAAQVGDFAQAEQLYRQGQYDRALERVEAHLAARPKDARGRFLKGMILTAQKKPAEAMKIYLALTHDYPELPEPYNNLAVLHAAQGQYDQARLALEMAVRADPAYAPAHENLGDIYVRMAAQSYDRAAKLDKNNRTAPRKLKLANELASIPPGR
jgi:tetratricopeptide (TPR) repeat protein